MTEPLKPAPRSDHAAHDPMWMAALAAKDPDLTPTELERARGALESCNSCADLLADLVAVSAAIPSAAIPRRPRDFTLTAADAARLRSRGLGRWFSVIGSARDRFTFPLALGLTTMGIAGLLLATVPGAFSGATGGEAQVLSTVGNAVPAAGAGGAATAAGPSAAPAATPASAPAAASAAPSGAPAAPSAERDGASQSDDYSAASAAASQETAGEPVFNGDDGDDANLDGTQIALQASSEGELTGLSMLAIVAAALLVAGIGLFALRWTARRLGDR